MNKYLFCLLLLCILSCINHVNKKEYLNQMLEKYFPEKDYNNYIVGEDKENLEKTEDITTYLIILYDLLKLKYVSDIKYFSEQKEFAYGYNEVIQQLFYYLENTKNENQDIILKILVEINNKPDANYINGFKNGLYKAYDKLLTKIKNSVNQEIINKFIRSLPDLKMIILSEYITLINFNENPDVNAFYHAYKEVNEQNYKQIFLSKKLFPYSTNKEREEYIENISYYFKLQQFIE